MNISESIQNIRYISSIPNIDREKIISKLWRLVLTVDPSQSNHPLLNSNFTLTPDNQRLQTENERNRVEKRLENFDNKNSQAWKDIQNYFGPSLSQNELLSIAQVITYHAKLKLDREAKRRKEVLIKWFDENYNTIKNLLPKIKLEDGDGNPITP